MARRSAEELSGTIRGLFGDSAPEGLEGIMEDIADSVQGIPAGYTSPEEAAALRARAEAAEGQYQSMRERYINRFYQDYNESDNQGLIMGGGVPQGNIQKEEKKITYADLFE